MNPVPKPGVESAGTSIVPRSAGTAQTARTGFSKLLRRVEDERRVLDIEER